MLGASFVYFLSVIVPTGIYHISHYMASDILMAALVWILYIYSILIISTAPRWAPFWFSVFL